ncbi:isopentenyl-diphosphate delta-isomerase [Exophiala spinifera]|uniref:isopentenyl-diphosphate Delta-isomerase n=1 Tax=Exophiala spinifera TaxID=91928 RepID=A0A0D2BR75_9EURO|nr:isopentenyl-diphosphate delta-isomerase [Exophiala spinifera]KIW21498.1 isopentenyl-diphosphate delta-isomerase [Exophiala spinifera]
MATTTTTTTTTTSTSATATTTTITRENVTTLFPDVHTRLIGADMAPNSTPDGFSSSSSGSNDDLAGYDEEQIRLMDEVCIVLDENDGVLGSASKKACHLMTNIRQGLLHRAFSAFVFDPRSKKLLLQQRASEKITFPDMWTNTCCSHPLAHPSETGAGDLVSNVEGAKRAAVRKLNHELGIRAAQVPLEAFRFLTRIHYLAPSDGKWGEHEIDYILFVEADVTLDVNPNEVRDTRWVGRDELRQMFADVETNSGRDKDLKYTPWFRLICEGMLFDWWEKLEQGKLSEVVNESQIRRML